MQLFVAVSLAVLLATSLHAQDGHSTAASVSAALQTLTIDANKSYHVRDLQLSRGDIKLYLTEGILSFVTPIEGRCPIAVFTTEHVEGGDGEVIVLPAQSSERASLAQFTKTPNLDEHFRSAVFLFSDQTEQEIMSQIEDRPIQRASGEDLSTEFIPRSVLQSLTSTLDTSLIKALLDQHKPEDGFFYGLISGGDLGHFAVLYDPTQFEPVSVGSPITIGRAGGNFQLWAAFRPRRASAYTPAAARIHDYRIATDIHPDLSMNVQANFAIDSAAADGRVLSFTLSNRLRVTAAQIDGHTAEVFQHVDSAVEGNRTVGSFLLISDHSLATGNRHQIEIKYEGSVIRKMSAASYFVDERNAWYPQCGPTLANFDLSFRCPKNLRLVSTGEPISEAEDFTTRTVHRQTKAPEALAGFNLGDYQSKTVSEGDYHIECVADRAFSEQLDTIQKQTEDVLRFYIERWGGLPVRSISVSPIPGYFGQGFPGLIYLSTASYMKAESRPELLRNTSSDVFFSELLLPHEVAHQWWGNIVAAADYRTNWLIEAMANCSALDFLEKKKGIHAVNQILDRYRQNLLRQVNGRTLESSGPLDFGFRLIDNFDMSTWHAITYEKGTWILRMLKSLIGADRFHQMQIRMLRDYATKPITEEEFRKLASEFVPLGYADKDLSLFFGTWVYSTGIPTLGLTGDRSGLGINLSGTAANFAVDVPLRCQLRGTKSTSWVRASYGIEPVAGSFPSGACTLPNPSEYLYIQ